MNGEQKAMNDNYIAFTFDEAEQTKRFYKDLTDDDIIYIEAAIRFDIETCENLLAKYFQMKMPKTVVKHEVWRIDKKNDIWVYEIKRKKKNDAGWLGEGVYFYGDRTEAEKAIGYGFCLTPFFVNIEYPFRMDVDLHNELIHANDAKVSARMTQYLEKNKMDGVLWAGGNRVEWCVLEPTQLKRATVTRDDQGRIIPISRRFDLSNPDNRF